MKIEEFVRAVGFSSGSYTVTAVLGEIETPLLDMTFATGDAPGVRHLPLIHASPTIDPRYRPPVSDAMVRAGSRHPGLDDVDLANLHRESRRHGFVEIFADINALQQGLITQLADSLGNRLARVVVSSTSIDVLHEYQSLARRRHDGSATTVAAWQLARGMRIIGELRAPVHIHQLAPGAARYFRRGRADSSSVNKQAVGHEDTEEATYISEDRQMIAAYWHYQATSSPRVPLLFVTSDFALAHACAAERVPFIFARAPREFDSVIESPLLWFDSFALKFRFCAPHRILWEMCQVFGTVNVVPVGVSGGGFSVTYHPRRHLPGRREEIELGLPVTPVAASGEDPSNKAGRKQPRAPTGAPAVDRKLKLSLRAIVDVLPTRDGQRISIAEFKPRDPDLVRQLWQVGDATGIYRKDNEEVVAGPRFGEFLAALRASDYVAVNAIFRAVAGYDHVLVQADRDGVFPNSREGGSAIGWAVMLGAAYKLEGRTIFGLRDVADEAFETAVGRAFAESAAGSRAVPLHRILDRVCSDLGLSPVRFETLLGRSIGQRALRQFEVQRATTEGKIPAHEVISLPSTSAPSSYLRRLEPGRGMLVGGKLVASLVRRPGI